MYDLIIVGGGPAALAAAVYALDKRLNLRVIAQDIGGKVGWSHQASIHTSAEPHLSVAVAQLFERTVNARSDLILRDRVVDLAVNGGHFAVVTQRRGTLLAKTVIVATGVSPITLDVPGARQWLGYGLGYSPTTYAPLLANKHVAVIGSSERALLGAAELARSVAQLYLILPDTTVHASPLLVQLQHTSNVVILEGYRVTALLGESKVERIALQRDDEESFVVAEAVFADLGLLPHSEMVRRVATLDAEGFIIVDSQHATTQPGLFAAGDVTSAWSEQVIVALGDGTRAAVSAYAYLLTHQDTAARVLGEQS